MWEMHPLLSMSIPTTHLRSKEITLRWVCGLHGFTGRCTLDGTPLFPGLRSPTVVGTMMTLHVSGIKSVLALQPTVLKTFGCSPPPLHY